MKGSWSDSGYWRRKLGSDEGSDVEMSEPWWRNQTLGKRTLKVTHGLQEIKNYTLDTMSLTRPWAIQRHLWVELRKPCTWKQLVTRPILQTCVVLTTSWLLTIHQVTHFLSCLPSNILSPVSPFSEGKPSLVTKPKGKLQLSSQTCSQFPCWKYWSGYGTVS